MNEKNIISVIIIKLEIHWNDLFAMLILDILTFHVSSEQMKNEKRRGPEEIEIK